MSRLLKQRLHDALEACQILSQLTDGLEFEDYVASLAVKGAVQWYLVALGEALGHARALDDELAVALPELPKVVGMRNRLVHGYWTIRDEVVWSAVCENVPALQGQLAALLGET